MTRNPYEWEKYLIFLPFIDFVFFFNLNSKKKSWPINNLNFKNLLTPFQLSTFRKKLSYIRMNELLFHLIKTRKKSIAIFKVQLLLQGFFLLLSNITVPNHPSLLQLYSLHAAIHTCLIQKENSSNQFF